KKEKIVSKSIISIFNKLFRNISNISVDLNSNIIPSNYLTIFEMNIRELAKQIALFDFKQMSQLDIGCLQNFNNTKNHVVQDIFKRSLKLQNWVMTEILSWGDINKRSIALSNFIQLCQ